MKILLGKIIESFTMRDVYRVIILDRDCSAEMLSGKSIEVEFLSGQSTIMKVTDAILVNGLEFGVKTGKIASLELENKTLPSEAIIGASVFLNKIKK